jgi:hypothetical protein
MVMRLTLMVEMPTQGEDSASEGDTTAEEPDVPAMDGSIPNCVGLSCENWCRKEVTMVNDVGEGVASGFVEFARASQTTLGEDNVGVVVCKVLQPNSTVACHSLRSWPIKKTLFQSVSLYDHLRKERSLQFDKLSRLGDRCGSRKYDCQVRIPRLRPLKRKDKIIQICSVNDAALSGYCKHLCMEQFDSALIYTLWHEMHHSDSKSKDALRLGVHRHFHRIKGESRQFCVLDGKLVCMLQWRKIYGVSKTYFYRYKQYVASSHRAQYHGGKERTKLSGSKLQAVQTMKMLLESKGDRMPHKTCNLKTSEKVMQKILLAGTKCKQILKTVNDIIHLTFVVMILPVIFLMQ